MPSQPLKFVIVCGLFLSTVMRPVDVSAQTAKELSAEADALFQQTRQLHIQGNYREAQATAERLIQIEKVVGAPISYAAAIELLGMIYMQTGRTAKAEEVHKQALEIRELALGPDHEHVAFSCHNLAIAYREWRRFAEADELHKRALAIMEKVHGPNSPDVGVTLVALGSSHFIQGRVAEAEPFLRRAIANLEKAPVQWDRDYASALVNMGNIFKAQGKFDEAEILHKKASAIYEKPQSVDRANLAAPLHNRGQIYEVQGRYREAEEMFRRAIELDSETYGSTSVKVARYWEGLGSVHRAAGNLPEAEKAYKRADSNYRRHGQTGLSDNIQYWLAIVNVARGQYAKAAPVIKKMLPRMREATHGRDHTYVAQALHNLGIIELSRKRWPEAAAQLRELGGDVARDRDDRIGGAGLRFRRARRARCA